MSDVKRYEPGFIHGGDYADCPTMDEKADGRWVRYEEFAALESDLATLHDMRERWNELVEERDHNAEVSRRAEDRIRDLKSERAGLLESLGAATEGKDE